MNQTDVQATDHDPFQAQLILALEHFTDLRWLKENSPLATPYFLGDYLNNAQSPFLGWGRTLQILLRQAGQMVKEMQDVDEADYLFQLIDVMYFQGLAPQPAADQLNVARATYYRHLKTKLPQAVRLMKKELVRLLKPGLRLEEPGKYNGVVVKRPLQFSQLLQALDQHQTVTLTGNIGIGKSTLAAQVFHHWKTHHKTAFWLTFRTGINDQLTSLLFALAYFLQVNGVPSLWLQMVADRGQINGEIALGIARRDLTQVKALPLLCFDNLDVLSPIDSEAHAQIESFLNGLQGIVPILMIGQRVDWHADVIIPVQELSIEQTRQLVTQNDVHLDRQEMQHLFQYTKGNPRLLNLFITLHNYGDTLADTLPRMTTSPSLEFLVNWIWSRLNEQSRTILSGLSVFRTSAPQDAWGTPVNWASLTTNQLIQTNKQGGMMLLSPFKRIIYEQLPTEDKEYLHLNAAVIREERGEYSAAAYHYIQGNQANYAIWLLNVHLQDQINQGRGPAMLELLAGLSKNHFDNPEQEMLVLLRSKLRQLIAEYAAIKADIYGTLWQTPVHEAQAQHI
ncbi:MAG: ATP-binding protein, partial [Chloroflexi bacterium]|nr:ATP-binding protein [Chloroflexota bacterium]